MVHRVVAFRSDTFRLGGTKYRVSADGVAAVKLLNAIVEASASGHSLFRFRPQLRTLRNSNCRALLCHVATITRDQKIRLIAIWLRSNCPGTIGIEAIARFSDAKEERIRVAVAKALQRMSGWSVLREMQHDPSPRVRFLAAPQISRPFNDRLDRFSHSVEPITSGSKQSRELYVSPDCELQNPITLRTRNMIRRVLERIRALVRSQHSVT